VTRDPVTLAFLAAVLTAALLAAASSADGGELIRYETAAGRVGWTDSAARIPAGATVTRRGAPEGRLSRAEAAREPHRWPWPGARPEPLARATGPGARGPCGRTSGAPAGDHRRAGAPNVARASLAGPPSAPAPRRARGAARPPVDSRAAGAALGRERCCKLPNMGFSTEEMETRLSSLLEARRGHVVNLAEARAKGGGDTAQVNRCERAIGETEARIRDVCSRMGWPLPEGIAT